MKKPIFRLLLFAFCLPAALANAQTHFMVSTLAGPSVAGNDTLNTSGYRNGPDSLALFQHPCGVAADKKGNIYIADTYNNMIRRVNADSTFALAGDTGAGFADGAGTAARFNRPMGICTDKNGNIYVADTYNNRIREVSPSGNVITYAGNGIQGDSGDGGPATAAELSLPVGVAADTIGNIYVTDNGNNVIREIFTNGTIATFAGSGKAGYLNGKSDTAEFLGLYGVAADDSGYVYVTEYINDDVRKIRNGKVTTLAGNDTNIVFHGGDTIPIYPFGYRNGKNDTALFYDPAGIAVDSSGLSVFVSDEYNYAIRKIGRDSVTTFAGDTTADSLHIIPAIAGYVNGLSPAARFNSPVGLALDNKGNVYVADNGNNAIRKIAPTVLSAVAPVQYVPLPAISAYPNPCSGRLMIASAPQGKAMLCDITGRVVWSSPAFKAPFVLNTAGFTPGVYLFSAQSAAGTVTQKIIVAH
ncbi:MAG: T9SS type A sorting domain-containing protein [Bacteroidia bacterium]|nr:T9SS type A sorting domain-containing protein [Bacteroidia bacterium]